MFSELLPLQKSLAAEYKATQLKVQATDERDIIHLCMGVKLGLLPYQKNIYCKFLKARALRTIFEPHRE
jgi:hypothetical protein